MCDTRKNETEFNEGVELEDMLDSISCAGKPAVKIAIIGSIVAAAALAAVGAVNVIKHVKRNRF